MFQSTPAIADGRTVALPRRVNVMAGFNPRPPSLTGELALKEKKGEAEIVSIHARHR